jgi:2-polyprenyl-3-methyl-5-hydroxy-6-metoxy-1,4-benzoquinol methylase
MSSGSSPGRPFPLDYEARGYAYAERANATLIALLDRHVLRRLRAPRILDVGCGAGANARAVLQRCPAAKVTGIEPNPRAAELSRAVCSEVFEGKLEDFLRGRGDHQPFDAIVLSDVIEHVVEPVRFLRALRDSGSAERARWFVSVPNYAVWYNRLRTLAGSFSYSWSGLYDRTHVRFFTQKSLRELLEHCGLSVVEQGSTPSLVQSSAPLLRRFFELDVARGEHLTLSESAAFRAYTRLVEPLESRICSLWPELLGFQIVSVAVPRR